jgi:hypothetical protein
VPSSARNVLLAATLALAAAQPAPVPLPRFADYPAPTHFTGRPAPPQLLTPSARLFRTRIRQAATQGPNFAGHYTIATWGCGSSCRSLALIDAKTGQVHPAPFSILGGYGLTSYPDETPSHAGPLQFQRQSRLLIARGCPEDTRCGSYYYEWQAPHWKLLRSVPAP